MADVYCRSCGEPWDTYHLANDAAPGDFVRAEWRLESVGPRARRIPLNKGAIVRCPCCPAEKRQFIDSQTPVLIAGLNRRNPSDTYRLPEPASPDVALVQDTAYALLSGDEDAVAAELEDFHADRR